MSLSEKETSYFIKNASYSVDGKGKVTVGLPSAEIVNEFNSHSFEYFHPTYPYRFISKSLGAKCIEVLMTCSDLANKN